MCEWCATQSIPSHKADKTRPAKPSNCPLCRKRVKQKVSSASGFLVVYADETRRLLSTADKPARGKPRPTAVVPSLMELPVRRRRRVYESHRGSIRTSLLCIAKTTNIAYAYSLFDGNMDCQAIAPLKSSPDMCKSRAAVSLLEPLFQSLPFGLPLCFEFVD